MADSVRQPRYNVKQGVGEASENVGDISSIENRLESGKKGDVNRWTMLGWNESRAEEGKNPGEDWRRRPEKLRGEGNGNGCDVCDGDEKLQYGRSHQVKSQKRQRNHEDIRRSVGDRELVLAELCKCLARIKRQIQSLRFGNERYNDWRDERRWGCRDVGRKREMKKAQHPDDRGEDHPGQRSPWRRVG